LRKCYKRLIRPGDSWSALLTRGKERDFQMNRTAAEKTISMLDHHAKPLKDMVLAISLLAGEKGWKAVSERGGANSWDFIHPLTGIRYKFRGRTDSDYRIEVSAVGSVVAVLRTRAQVREFFRKH
jgi:hypothetical protein